MFDAFCFGLFRFLGLACFLVKFGEELVDCFHLLLCHPLCLVGLGFFGIKKFSVSGLGTIFSLPVLRAVGESLFYSTFRSGSSF